MSSIKYALSPPSSLSVLTDHIGHDAAGAIEPDNDQLASLMEDYVRATQLQISLKKRIDALLKERSRKAKEEEEAAKRAFEDALAKTRKMQVANVLIIEKMKQAQGMGLDIEGGEKDFKIEEVYSVRASPIDSRLYSPTPAPPAMSQTQNGSVQWDNTVSANKDYLGSRCIPTPPPRSPSPQPPPSNWFIRGPASPQEFEYDDVPPRTPTRSPAFLPAELPHPKTPTRSPVFLPVELPSPRTPLPVRLIVPI